MRNTLKGLVTSFIESIDMLSYLMKNHHRRTAILAYYLGREMNLSEEKDIIAYSDIYAALSEERPYRKGLRKKDILKIMEEEFKEKHGKNLFQLINEHIDEIDILCKQSIHEGHKRFEVFKKFTDQYVHIA